MTLISRSRWKNASLDGQPAIRMQCPSCRVIGRLYLSAGDSLGHQIDQQGQVTPSVVCGNDDCVFHDYITLEGWAGIL